MAVICLIELCGPSRFSHWADDGTPVGRPHPNPWVQVAAVSKDQTRNTMKVFPTVISEKLKADYQLDVGIEQIRGMGGRGTLEAVTSNHRALEGGRITFCVLNETHHWVESQGGIAMYMTADGNAAKKGNRYIAITNAFIPGEESAAEKMRNAYNDILEARAEDFGFMYDTIEAHPETPMTPDGLRFAVPIIRGDSWWVTPENVIPSAMKTDRPVTQSRRMYLNQIVSGEDRLWTEKDFDALYKPGEMLRPGDKIVLGFDGSKSNDATALVAIRCDDGFVQPLLIEEKPSGELGKDWKVNKDKVISTVNEAFRQYSVQGFYADVNQWESEITDWTEQYGHALTVQASSAKPIHWDMRGGGEGGSRKVALAHEALMSSITEKKLHHAGLGNQLVRRLRTHTLNAVRRESSAGVTFGKESRESPKKVDAYAALMLANACWNDYRSKDRGKPKTGKAWFF